jgi:uncharacterized protein YPO0396
VILTVKERLTKIETQITDVFRRFDKLETNHFPHMQASLDSINERLAKLENCQKNRLSGKDKAVVYGSFITASSLIIVQIIQALIH